MKSKRRTNLVALFVLTPAMLDCFAIPLLVIANRRQQNYRQAPVVPDDGVDPTAKPVDKPQVIELTGGQPKLDGQSVSWERLPEQIQQRKDSQQFVVRVRTTGDGQGPVSDVLRLSSVARQHGFVDRVLFLSRAPDDQLEGLDE